MHFDSFKKAADNQIPMPQNPANFHLQENPFSPLETGPTENLPSPVMVNVQQQPETRKSPEEEHLHCQKAG